MIETEGNVASSCGTCKGAGWLRMYDEESASTVARLVRCSCNPKPIDQVADAENARAFSDEAKAKRRGDRAKWWA